MRTKALSCFMIMVFTFAPDVSVRAQSTRPTTLPVSKLPDGWEQIDERLLFLSARLSSLEASLGAIQKAIRQAGYKQTVKKDEADRYRKGNELMDRNAGGPVAWQDFYGRTAEKFFYHPVDPNSHYLTKTLITQQPAPTGPSGTVLAPQQLPIPQRPPQFEYVYRVNNDAQQRAADEAMALGGQIDRLLERRRKLETEQSALWYQIAFQAVASRNLAAKPMYRFDWISTEPDAAAAERITALRSAQTFVRGVNRFMTQTQDRIEADQGAEFALLRSVVQTARADLDDTLQSQPSLAADLANPQSALGELSAAAKRLSDLTQNIADAHRLAVDGDSAGDDQRKDTFRGLLQDKLLSSAETLLLLDACVSTLSKQWHLVPDPQKPVAALPPLALPHVSATGSVASPSSPGFNDSPTPGSAAAPAPKPIVKAVTPPSDPPAVTAWSSLPDSRKLRLVPQWQSRAVKTTIDSATVDGKKVLTQDQSPYLISGTLHITEGGELSVGPGTVLLFAPDASVDNAGVIRLGSDGDWIVLAAADSAKPWKGIAGKGELNAQRCLFTGVTDGPAIKGERKNAFQLSQCVFVDNQIGLDCGNNASGTVEHSLFVKNSKAFLAHGDGGTVNFSHCLFTGNGQGAASNFSGYWSGSDSTFFANEVGVAAPQNDMICSLKRCNVFGNTKVQATSRGGRIQARGNYWGDLTDDDPTLVSGRKPDLSGRVSKPFIEAVPVLPKCPYLEVAK